MLHSETVDPETLSILIRLQSLPELKDFYLVGGTALSLKYGHRKSIDLDLFSHVGFEKEAILTALSREFKMDFVYEHSHTTWAIFCFIKDVKVDIVKYDHPIISSIHEVDDIRMYGDDDIIAMKVNAVLGRGKKKDFWDISELLNHYSLDHMISCNRNKYPQQMILISIPSALTYFADADESEEAVSLRGETWESVKEHIQLKVREYLS